MTDASTEPEELLVDALVPSVPDNRSLGGAATGTVVDRADLELPTTGREGEPLQSATRERHERHVVEAGPPVTAGRLGEHDLAAGPGLRDRGVDAAVGPGHRHRLQQRAGVVEQAHP